MKSPESSSATVTAESTMNDNNTKTRNIPQNSDEINDSDPAVWAAFTENFRQVQSVLDQNRALIQQVNENHQSKVHGNMVKNVALIQEINANISKVVSLYSDLSANFSDVFHHKNGKTSSEEDR